MDVLIIDGSRNIREAPAKGAPFKNALLTLDALIDRHAAALHTGQVEIVADPEFMAALMKADVGHVITPQPDGSHLYRRVRINGKAPEPAKAVADKPKDATP